VIMKLIAIVGMPGAGKSLAAEYFRKMGIPVLRFGDQVDIGLAEHHLERNEKNERWYREKLRQELGMAAMAVKIEPRIIEASGKNDVIVLDGLYSWEEYFYLKSRFPDIILLCVYAPPQIRYRRLAERKVRPLTNQEARDRDRAEIENLNKGGPIAVADYLVKNITDENNLASQLDEFYTSL
jgi:dephospho-CoA kinase